MDVSAMFHWFLLWLCCSIRSSDGNPYPQGKAEEKKECEGGNVESLLEECVLIVKKPLIIKGQVNEEVVREKLKNVEKILTGIEIIGTRITNFDFLQKLETIDNPDGYAIIFSENKKLARFSLPACHTLYGTPKAVQFKNDMFLWRAANIQNETLGDFVRLELMAHTGLGSDWYNAEMEPSQKMFQLNTLTVAMGIVCIVAFVLLIVGILQIIGLVQLPFVIEKKSGSHETSSFVEEGQAKTVKSSISLNSSNENSTNPTLSAHPSKSNETQKSVESAKRPKAPAKPKKSTESGNEKKKTA